MADYHILTGDKYGNSFSVVMHLPIPNTDNAVGINYRIALSEYMPNPISRVPFISQLEQAALDNGELLEYSINYKSNPGLTPTENRNILRLIWNELQQDGGSYEDSEPNVITEWQNRLKYWHYEDSVP